MAPRCTKLRGVPDGQVTTFIEGISMFQFFHNRDSVVCTKRCLLADDAWAL